MKRQKDQQTNHIHPSTRIVSILLTLFLLFSAFPPIIFAEENGASVEQEASISQDMTEDAVTYTEIPEQRDRFTKHFQRSDGKHVAVVYSEAIHTLENGEMVNVDNRLTLNGTRYETKNTGFGASFAKSVTEENLITLSFEGYTLSWHIGVIRNLSDIQPWQRINASSEATLLPQTALELPTTNVMGRVKTVAIEDANDRRSFSKDEIGSTFLSTSGMTYSNAFSGSGIVDLVYTLSDNRLEEDILIREKGNIHSYVLTMSAKDMTARLNEDNSIIFVDEYDNEIFTIAAPWMHDATYTFSNAITVSLVQKGDLVTVIYTPDSEWLNASERVYPVLIDPSVKSRNYTSNYQDTFTYSGNTADRSAMTYTRVGKGNETYFKLLHYPMMLDAVNVESATLNIRGSANSTNLRMRVLTTAWEQSTLTYENRPLGLATVYTATTDTTSTGWRVFDLMPAMNDLAYGEADDFFNTIEGFRIYHDSTSSLYLLISSEATETDMRPYIEITYEYVHDIPVENGGVYTIKNAYSGKSLMASTSSTNVFQYSSSITNAQAFKTIGSDGCFTFESMSRTGEVLTYAYSGSETQNTVNVYTAAKTTALADSQEFLFQYVSDNSSGYQLYAIVSRADTTMALTALGTSNGSPSSAGTSTAGNVVMAPYTGSTNQLWYLESGRQPVFVGNDIVAMNSTTMAFDYGVLASYIQPYCYVTSFGETITWSSNNAAAASIATNGKVTVNGAGKVTFTATIKNSAGNELRQYSYTVIIAMGNGVYRIKNVGTGLYLGVEGETLNNNTNVTVSNKMTSGFEQYGQLWKIFYIGNGKYSIRPMQKLTMAMNRSSSNVLLYSAGITDTTAGVPTQCQWGFVMHQAGGYVIQYNGQNGSVLTLTSGDVNTRMYSSTLVPDQTWQFEEVNVSEGVILMDHPTWLAPKESSSVKASVYSYALQDQSVSISSSNHAIATVSGGNIVGVSEGTATITVASSAITGSTKTFTVNISNMENGEYLFRNPEQEEVITSDDSSDSPFMNDFEQTDNQLYELIRFENDFYQIKSKTTGLYLTVPNNSTDTDIDIVESAWTGSLGQQWKFELMNNGMYKVYTRAVSSMEAPPVLSASVFGDVKQDTWVDNDSYRDAWHIGIIHTTSTVPLIAQEESNWCWAAAVLMFAKHYQPSITLTQEQIVEAALQTDSNVGGELGDIQKAFNEIEFPLALKYAGVASVSQTPVTPNITAIYSEEIIRRFIDDGHIIYMGRRWTNAAGGVAGGHAVLLYGYIFFGQQCYYLFKDPGPVGEGAHTILSYAKFCNGYLVPENDWSDYELSKGIWLQTVVCETDYSDELLPPVFLESN